MTSTVTAQRCEDCAHQWAYFGLLGSGPRWCPNCAASHLAAVEMPPSRVCSQHEQSPAVPNQGGAGCERCKRGWCSDDCGGADEQNCESSGTPGRGARPAPNKNKRTKTRRSKPPPAAERFAVGRSEHGMGVFVRAGVHVVDLELLMEYTGQRFPSEDEFGAERDTECVTCHDQG
jgi:hypothetical protein